MIVIRCDAYIHQKDFDKLRETLLSQAKDGLVVVPSFCSVYIDPQPGDIEVRVEEAVR